MCVVVCRDLVSVYVIVYCGVVIRICEVYVANVCDKCVCNMCGVCVCVVGVRLLCEGTCIYLCVL